MADDPRLAAVTASLPDLMNTTTSPPPAMMPTPSTEDDDGFITKKPRQKKTSKQPSPPALLQVPSPPAEEDSDVSDVPDFEYPSIIKIPPELMAEWKQRKLAENRLKKQ